MMKAWFYILTGFLIGWFIVEPIAERASAQERPVPCIVENTTLQFPEPKCHDDEDKVTDSSGGMKCVKKQKYAEYDAETCLKDFYSTSGTKLIVPLDSNGSPKLSEARLENFEFKNVCPQIKAEQ